MSTQAQSSEYLLIFRNISWHKELSAEEMEGQMARFTAWFEKLSSEGKFKCGAPLGHQGKTLSSKTNIIDGPFPESKEAVAGFFVLRAGSLAEAAETAKGCPSLDFGQTVEVRPLVLEPDELAF